MISAQKPSSDRPTLAMPALLYGTAWKKERTEALVIKAIETGFQGIDTACQPKHYHESGVGVALQRLQDQNTIREKLFIQTKFTPLAGQDPKRIPYDPDASVEDQVKQSFETSIHNLQTDYVNAFILHSPIQPHSKLMAAWHAMEAIYQQGGTHQLGISNCYELATLKQLYTNATVKPSIVQNRFYQQTQYDSVLRQWCLDQGVVYQSFGTLTANPHLLASSVVKQLAQHYQRTSAQILFRYLNQRTVMPLTGTCSELHMREDLDILTFKLLGNELQCIDAELAQ
ncbi:MAG: aldo/keto reductase [Pseudomonadales bacterium]